MNRFVLIVVLLAFVFSASANAQHSFTLQQILSAPFPSDLTAAKKNNRLAWVLDQEGKRNLWVAEGPAFAARPITKYNEDDGQELSQVSFSADANTIVFVRGGGKNSAGQVPNPTSNPAGMEQAVWTIAWNGSEPKRVDAGHSPDISSRGTIAYTKDGQIWLAPLDGSEKPRQLVVRGQHFDPHWSPDGSKLAFVSARGDHSFITVYDVAAKTVEFVAPTVDSDSNFVWSLDGRRIAFVRRPAEQRDAPQGFFIAPDKPRPWAIWVADASTRAAKEIWHSNVTLQGSFPYMAEDTGGGVLNWAADNQLVVASEEDGWQHLYALSADGSAPKLLTPGNCEVEQWSFTPDKKTVLFNSNCGDVDRRHIWKVDADGKGLQQLTSGKGLSEIEWSGVVASDGMDYFYIGSDAKHPGRIFHSLLAPDTGTFAATPETWPKDFPPDRLVTPQQAIFKSGDGLEIHGQLFVPKDLKSGEKRPAVIFLHGGPIRQMLLGWHYMFYYSNSYAMNHYLASRGYVVLALNYRSGIGYGRAFREAPGRAGRGATEYQDVVAAGKYLQSRPDVDGKRIGLWGGSYGGYSTALGLGRNSDLFAAGVDLHGVHDWPTDNWDGKNIPSELNKLAHDSSPVTSVNTWKSPVLFIHGDDDRNVYFTQTVDLVARLREHGVEIEQLIFPDEIHDFLLHRDWLAAYHAASDFFDRHFKMPEK
ncbi:MAG TPA: prolyl oligopeptidase family serine peptidase [Candidatus Angelobacter sp.]|nr:prolyl oligopeptidase family serine peptidase [Candidatus Angelobacter sp.]